jgi:site-specific recombinase XerD
MSPQTLPAVSPHVHVGRAMAILRRLGMSQRAVSRHLGVHEGNLCNYRVGRAPMPPTYHAALVALLRGRVQHAKAHPLPAPVRPLEIYPLDQSPVVAYLSTLAKSGRDSMRWNLARAVRVLTQDQRQDPFQFPWHTLRYPHVLALRATLIDRGYAPATCEGTLAAVRGVLTQCWLLGLMPHEDYARCGKVPPVTGSRLPAGRWVDEDELVALFRSCATDANRVLGARDRALFAVLFGCGLRRVEAASLDVADYDQAAGAIRVRFGKGNKERLVPCNAAVRQALEDWLTLRGCAPGALFPCLARGRTGAAQIRGKPLSYRVIGVILQKRARAAGVQHCTPHDARRSFISRLLDAGADLNLLSLTVGHSNISITAAYDRRPLQRRQAMVQLLSLPYVSPRGQETQPPVTAEPVETAPPAQAARPEPAVNGTADGWTLEVVACPDKHADADPPSTPRARQGGKAGSVRRWHELNAEQQAAIRERLRTRVQQRR